MNSSKQPTFKTPATRRGALKLIGGAVGEFPPVAKAKHVTRGPCFVDDGAEGVRLGVPLTLRLAIRSINAHGNCGPLAGAQVQLRHANAQGVYSDIGSVSGQDFLRGHQLTDAAGIVTFNTIYPGWYLGRTVHIHLNVRAFNATGAVTAEATTQLFFNDAVSEAVFAGQSAYQRGDSLDTANSQEDVYSSEDPARLVALTGDAASGYQGVASLAIQVGSVFGV